MSRRPMRGRCDANQAKVIRELKQSGCSVVSISSLGGGVGDVLIGLGGFNYLAEIKDPMQIPSKRRLTPDEKQFHATWAGQICIIETAQEFMQKVQVTRG